MTSSCLHVSQNRTTLCSVPSDHPIAFILQSPGYSHRRVWLLHDERSGNDRAELGRHLQAVPALHASLEAEILPSGRQDLGLASC
jgi:hypothetical protein